MKVSKLIELLQKLPPDYKIYFEDDNDNNFKIKSCRIDTYIDGSKNYAYIEGYKGYYE